MVPLDVNRLAERLGNEAILLREIRIAITAHTFVCAPREGTMVDKDILAIVDGQGVALDFVLVAHSETHKTDDDVTSLNHNRVARNTDAISRRRLTSDGQIATSYV